MNRVEEIAKALRCSITPGGECNQECRYCMMEEVSSDLPCPPDVELDGKKYWLSCDVDAISVDAAIVLEKLLNLAEDI